jgi:hypothetical protein
MPSVEVKPRSWLWAFFGFGDPSRNFHEDIRTAPSDCEKFIIFPWDASKSSFKVEFPSDSDVSDHVDQSIFPDFFQNELTTIPGFDIDKMQTQVREYVNMWAAIVLIVWILCLIIGFVPMNNSNGWVLIMVSSVAFFLTIFVINCWAHSKIEKAIGLRASLIRDKINYFDQHVLIHKHEDYHMTGSLYGGYVKLTRGTRPNTKKFEVNMSRAYASELEKSRLKQSGIARESTPSKNDVPMMQVKESQHAENAQLHQSERLN